MIKRMIPGFLTMLLAAGPLSAAPPTTKPVLDVVTSTTDLRDIAQEVGGTRVSVINISEWYQDPHFVEAKPSFILRLQRAHLLVLSARDTCRSRLAAGGGSGGPTTPP